MKKVILTTLIAVAVPMLALAQGTVNFGSSDANKIIVYNNTLLPVTGAAGFLAGLYGGPASTAEGSLSLLGATVGVINGGGIIPVTRTNTFVAGGATGTFQVRAWDGGYANYEAALLDSGNDGWAGKTVAFQNGTGNPAGSPPTVAAGLDGWNAPLQVSPVPEPSTIALAGLGMASLLYFRRRK